MSIQVFKFGGASVKDAAGVQNLQKIVKLYANEPLLVVVSAMGKTTNLLEELTSSYFYKKSDTTEIFEKLKKQHEEILSGLFEPNDAIYEEMAHLWVEIEWILEEEPSTNYDFVYDQLVSVGELASTKIIAAFLQKSGLEAQWLDARSVIRTDNTYREGKVDWETTKSLVNTDLVPVLSSKIIVTQGFIGGTSENYTTTLGREGSDYTAAILATCLQAQAVTIWKDVPGLLNADPKHFSYTQKYDTLPYAEAIEMAYYGASVIHPKTLQPLELQKIPLYVKSFVNPKESGTCITSLDHFDLPIPAIILKTDQILISIQAKDLTFVTESGLSEIFGIIANERVKINVMQISALSFSICIDNNERSKKLISALQTTYRLKYNDKLKLVTIRHFNQELINKLQNGCELLLEQRSRTTVQMVLKQIEA